MDFTRHGTGWLEDPKNQVEEEWTNERPAKRPRTSLSHGSIGLPSRSPFHAMSVLADSLGYDSEDRRQAAKEKKDVEKRRGLAQLRLRAAISYEHWRQAAAELDRLNGNDEWKAKVESSEYDVDLVKARIRVLGTARQSEDLGQMRFQIRNNLSRDLAGMSNAKLYTHSYTGTKHLVERYIGTVLDTINGLVEAAGSGDSDLPARETWEQVKFARQTYGRSALLLSGGGTLGMNHIGVVRALFEAKALPRIISGASAGSIVCAVLCTKTDVEVPEFLHDFCNGDLAVFEAEQSSISLVRMASRLLRVGAIYDVKNLNRVMKNLIGDMTFLEAYNRTQRILNICVSTADIYALPTLLNYVSAPHVTIWSAVAASCSVPLVFTAAKLHYKDPYTGVVSEESDTTGKWIDGSVDNDLPMTRLAEMFNVNHFIVSQVNPHVVPFLAKENDRIVPDVTLERPPLSAGPTWVSSMAELAKSEALHRLHVLAEMGIAPTTMTKVRSVLGQKYSGDITILPEISYTQFPSILSNPTSEFMVQAMLNGERATWPKLSRIRNHLAIELALDAAVHELQGRVAFSPSQVNLRQFAYSQKCEADRGRKRRLFRRSSHDGEMVITGPRSRRSSLRMSKAMVNLTPYLGQEAASGYAECDSSGADSQFAVLPSLALNESSDTDSDRLEYADVYFSMQSGIVMPLTSQSQPATPSIASRRFLLGSPDSTRPSFVLASTGLHTEPLGSPHSLKSVPLAFEHPGKIRKRRSMSTGLQGLKPPNRQ